MENIFQFLNYIAYKLRKNVLKSTSIAGSDHPTSCFSAAEIISVLFFKELNLMPKKTGSKKSFVDKFILSKGHAAPILYAAWSVLGALEENELFSLRKIDSRLEGHPTPRFPYVDVATGSLGMGLSVATAMALTSESLEKKFFSYVLLGDGETTEGSVWEAVQIADFYNLNNLIAIVDVNCLGQSGETLDKCNLKKMKKKWEAFGWNTHVIDGHKVEEISKAVQKSKKSKKKPSVILAKTLKGKGLKKAENKLGFHGKVFDLDKLKENLEELKENFYSKYGEIKNFEITLEQKTFEEKLYNLRKKIVPYIKQETKTSFCEKNSIFGPALERVLNLFKNLQKSGKISTRKSFGIGLTEYAKNIKNIVCIDGDVKNSTFTEFFEESFPERFYQCFIAEQCMIGMSMGFAAMKQIPFAATFGAFLTRAHDQIRMAAISNLPLRLVGSHAGVSIGEDGPSQMALEDISMMRSVPNSVVLYPADFTSTVKLVGEMIEYHEGISYLRTTRSDTPILYPIKEEFHIGGCKVLKHGKNDQCCIIGAGITVFESLKAFDVLSRMGIKTSIIDCYSIKPLAFKKIKKVAEISKKIICVEDHYAQGGLGEAICYSFRNTGFQIETLAVRKLPRSGSTKDLFNYEEIGASAIVNSILKLI